MFQEENSVTYVNVPLKRVIHMKFTMLLTAQRIKVKDAVATMVEEYIEKHKDIIDEVMKTK